MKKMLDVRMVAGRLGVGTTTIYRLIKTGQIKCTQMGPKKGYKIDEKEVMMMKRYGFRDVEPE